MLKASDVMCCMMGHKVRTNVNAQSSTISALLIASVSISGATLTACSPSSPTSQSASTSASSANGNNASNTNATPNASLASATAAVPNQLTIYTSIDKAALEPLLTSYARQINVPIHIVQDEPMSILARLKAEGANSPADVILTEDAGIFSTAVEEGLLQPFNAEKAVAHVPERYRDPDGNWIALSSYARTAVYDSRVLHTNDISSYADLSKPKWSQKLCLSQGKYIPNQSLVVNLINNLGDKRTQEVMQGWLANLSVPLLLDDNEVLKAIESGKCQIGLVNSNHYGRYLQAHPNTPIKIKWINKGYGGVSTNITGVAIPHAAKHTELALGLIEWLAAKDQQSLYASLSNTFPIDPNAEASVLLKSWGDIEVSPIPVRFYGERQALAVDSMQQAGYY